MFPRSATAPFGLRRVGTVMVDVVGHLGMALVWLAPLWLVLDDPETVALGVAGGFWFGVLPDVDVLLAAFIPGVHHHGVVHTVLAATLFALFLGPPFGLTLRRVARRVPTTSARSTRQFVTLGVGIVWVTCLSHVFADILSAPDIASRIEPLWPLVDGPVVMVDLVWYNSPYVNWGLLLGGLALNAALAYRAGLWGSGSAGDRRRTES